MGLAEKLEARRNAIMASRGQMIAGATKGLKVQELGAKKKVENDRIREANQFNPINALVEGGTAYLTSGGNPLAAVSAAASSKRGKTDVVGAALGGGVSKGASIKNLGAGKDVGKTIQALGKEENLDKTIATLKTHGVPDKAIKPLEDYSKIKREEEALKVKQVKKDATDIKETIKGDKKTEEDEVYNKWESEISKISKDELQKRSPGMITMNSYIRTLEHARDKVNSNSSLSTQKKDKLKSKIEAKIKEARKQIAEEAEKEEDEV